MFIPRAYVKDLVAIFCSRPASLGFECKLEDPMELEIPEYQLTSLPSVVPKVAVSEDSLFCHASCCAVSSRFRLGRTYPQVREAPQEHDGALRALLAEREGGGHRDHRTVPAPVQDRALQRARARGVHQHGGRSMEISDA